MPSDLLFSPSWKFSLGSKITVQVGGNSKGTLKVRPAGQGGLGLGETLWAELHAGCCPSLSLPLGSGPCFWVSAVSLTCTSWLSCPLSTAHRPRSHAPYLPFVSSAAGTLYSPRLAVPLALSAASHAGPGDPCSALRLPPAQGPAQQVDWHPGSVPLPRVSGTPDGAEVGAESGGPVAQGPLCLIMNSRPVCVRV